MEKNNKKVINAWCMYDWANSVYSLTITTAVFPIYYSKVTTGGSDDKLVDFLFWNLPATSLYSYALSISFLITALVLPLLTGISDYGGMKKRFLKGFAYLGALACMGLFFFDGPNIEYGILMAVLASIGYSGSLVFYDAFLPEIATKDKYDAVSARGYSFGYIGSVLLLIFNLIMIMFPHLFGIEDPSMPAKISFVTVGVWWIVFSQIPFKILPDNPHHKKADGKYLLKGYQEIKKVWQSLEQLPQLKTYLFGFFFFNAGVQAIMYLATPYGTDVLQLNETSLIIVVLIIQLVAVLGSVLFARISKSKGNIFALSSMILIWILVCILAYIIQTEYQFYALAFLVGLIMGGIQSLSRATYTKLIPQDSTDNASYFSFYDVTYNLSIVMGTLSFGLAGHFTGSLRNSALVLAVFFVIGLIIIQKVRKENFI